MLGYAGTMTDRHLRASVRAALAMRALEFTDASYRAAAKDGWQRGVRLRNEILAASMASADVGLLEETDPGFWNRIPLIAELGFGQTSLFQSLMPSGTNPAREAAVLGAGFNLAITLIDYCVDEMGAGDPLFRCLNESLVRAIFAAGGEAESRLAAAIADSHDVRERALFGVIAFCASRGQTLLQANANETAWKNLGRTIALLLEGESRVSSVAWPSAAKTHQLLPFLEAKSCLPSVAALQIAWLGCRPGELTPDPDLSTAAAWLGTLFWLLDDLVDLLKDLRSGAPNAVLLRMADRLAAEGRSFAADKDIYDEVDRTAEDLAGLVDLLTNQKRIDSRGALCRFASQVVAGWTGALDEGTGSHTVGDRANAGGEVASNALAFLLSQQAAGLKEAIHNLYFPRLFDDGVRYETRPSILSHRAVILDALLDAAEAGLDCPAKVLSAEVMAILRAKHRDANGGWSYIQEAPELPPDADDLGQVLQVLVRFGGCDLASICDEAIRIVLDSAEEDGSFCTWILDPAGHSAADQRMRDYLPVMGGWGIHPEVVANLLYGLCLYDPGRYWEPLQRSVRYLEKVQNADGSWSSKWYRGPFYGTWRGIAVLGRLAPDSAYVMRAQRYLVASQCDDGGWGDGTPEPLSTALAMLALSGDSTQAGNAALTAGSAWLARTQQPDGGWAACPWISFPTLDGPVVYGSASITSAFCLKALLAAEKVRTRQSETRQSLTVECAVSMRGE